MVSARVLAAVAVAMCLGCYDAPLERANPNDPDFAIVMSLESTRDTVTRDNQWVAFTLVTDPVIVGYEPRWESTYAALVHEGNGVFRLTAWPTSVIPVIVRARFLDRTVQTTVYAAPVPSP
jgi:hypothetical protein